MDQERTYKWVQDRLHDLHAGTLSDEDRLRLEDLATTDPFIKDAMEGYQAHANHDHSLLLKVLSQRIQNKNASRRPKLLPLSRGWVMQAVAASLVLILATWAVIYYVDRQDDPGFAAASGESSSIERSTEVQLIYPDSSADDLTPGTTQSAEAEKDQTGLRDYAKTEAGQKIDANVKSEPKETVLTDVMNKGQDDVALTESVPSAPASAQPEPDETKKMTEEFNPGAAVTMAAGAEADKKISKRDEGYFANQISPELMSKRVTGQVVGPHGESVIGAMISIPNTNLLTTTDFYGKFELFLPGPTSSVEVINTGYKDTMITVVQGQEDLVIALDEKENLLPTAGILAGGESRAQKSELKTGSNAFPKDSLSSFLAYLAQHSRYPVQNNFNSKSKAVTVDFSVRDHGKTILIQKIESSADKKYIAEAMRLIQNRPDWVCDNEIYPCKRQFTIYFE